MKEKEYKVKQLINIKASSLRAGDLIFDYKHRDLQRIDYISKEDEIGNPTFNQVSPKVTNIHVSYGEEAASADNFKPNNEVTILIDTDELNIIEPRSMGYR